ncbi:MAG: NAD(P)/FAD-dependent oxidoreductase [Myxococcota bacterium]
MEHVDVLIVGAGISGIGAACHLRRELPDRTFVLLEGRDTFGGTWDLFRYPGIRSDSDMYTFGFAFRPWPSNEGIASAEAIRTYLGDTIDEYALGAAIRYRHRVLRVAWSSSARRWTVTARRLDDGAVVQLTCGFLVTGTGYYDYERGYTPDFSGLDDFEGDVVHPQHWPEDLDCTGKRVVVVGSGATAVTLVPALAPVAAHVTMLQRSPSYVVSRTRTEPISAWLRRWLPPQVAHTVIRAKNSLMAWLLFRLAKRFPDRVRQILVDGVRQGTDDAVDVDAHFTPTYGPWDQRLCFVPDGDLFEALKSDRADVVTDTIDHFDSKGVVLASGERLDADVVVTATGLQLKFLGGIEMQVDGRTVDASDLVTYRGVLFGNVPNWLALMGYTSSSWTLKVDLAARYLCRLLRSMERRGADLVVPVLDEDDQPTLPYMAHLANAGYVRRGARALPRQRTTGPWRNRDDYFADLAALQYGRLDDGVLRFQRRRALSPESATTEA